MKKKTVRGILILLIMTAVLGAMSYFLSSVSYNPNFTVFDAISGATQKYRLLDMPETSSAWAYTRDKVALTGEDGYSEEQITVEDKTYTLLIRDSADEDGELVFVSNKGDLSYRNAVKKIAAQLEEEGKKVKIKEYTETMMLSLVHAGHFDLFLMSEEAAE